MAWRQLEIPVNEQVLGLFAAFRVLQQFEQGASIAVFALFGSQANECLGKAEFLGDAGL